jgi:glucose/arabinose dehydrogenase
MPVAYTIYTIALAYITTVAVALLAYGTADYRSGPDKFAGILEAGAGTVVGLYLLVFQFEGLTDSLVRGLTQGSLAARSYVLLPVVAGVVTTDYLLRRIVPVVEAGVRRLTARLGIGETSESERTGTRRSVLGASLGVATAGLAGGFTLLEETLRSSGDGTDGISEFRRRVTYEAPYFPTALDFSEAGYGYVTSLEGGIFRFEQPSSGQESLAFTQVASGIQYPQGVEVTGDTLYTVDNGSAAGGKYGTEEGYEVLQESNGEVLAFDVGPDGSLSNRRTILSDLPVVNSDHALHQIETGPDGRLHLSIGHLGGGKYPEMFDGKDYEPGDADHPNHEYLGTVISFEPDGSDVEIVATGLRNVYDITFDRHGNLFGANNDGMSTRSKVWESLLHITDGADFGYPEYGTFDPGPPDEDVTDPLWTLDGVQSTGVETTDELGAEDGVVVGLLGKIAFVPIERGEDGVYVPEFLRPEPSVIEPDGPPIVVEAGPDGSLWVGTVGRDDTFTLYEPAS